MQRKVEGNSEDERELIDYVQRKLFERSKHLRSASCVTSSSLPKKNSNTPRPSQLTLSHLHSTALELTLALSTIEHPSSLPEPLSLAFHALLELLSVDFESLKETTLGADAEKLASRLQKIEREEISESAIERARKALVKYEDFIEFNESSKSAMDIAKSVSLAVEYITQRKLESASENFREAIAHSNKKTSNEGDQKSSESFKGTDSPDVGKERSERAFRVGDDEEEDLPKFQTKYSEEEELPNQEAIRVFLEKQEERNNSPEIKSPGLFEPDPVLLAENSEIMDASPTFVHSDNQVLSSSELIENQDKNQIILANFEKPSNGFSDSQRASDTSRLLKQSERIKHAMKSLQKHPKPFAKSSKIAKRLTRVAQYRLCYLLERNYSSLPP